MIVLEYQKSFGTCDEVAMFLAQQDIVNLDDSWLEFYFGNRIYLEEWLLAQLEGVVGIFQVKFDEVVCTAENGNLDVWPDEMLIALEQYKRRVKLSFS